MEKEINQHPQPISPGVIEELRSELNDLDLELIDIDGQQLKPSQCYHFDVDPVHMLFNTNCPDTLKQKVQAILSKYLAPDESRAQQ